MARSTAIKRLHLTELRTAANALRALAGLSAFGFGDDPLASRASPKAFHLEELRAAVAAARTALGLGAVSYSHTIFTRAVVRAADFLELRNAVK